MRHLTLTAIAFAGLFACNGDKDTTDTGGDTATSDFFSTLVNSETPIVTEGGEAEDLSCWTGGQDWISQIPSSECQVDTDVSGIVSDFETGDPVDEATVEIFLTNTVPENGAADQSSTTDVSGNVTLGDPIATCSPFTYRVSTDPARDETIVTLDAHQVVAPGEGQGFDFQSVSTATYAIIPSLLGVTVDDTKGAVAGTAYDCNGDPIQEAQVILRDSEGNYPDSQVVRYFENEFPVRTRTTTSEDGLWVLLNVPAGRGNVVELYGVTEAGGEPILLATSPVDVFADSLNVSSTTYGFEGGVVYPDSCLDPSCGEDEGTEDTGTGS